MTVSSAPAADVRPGVDDRRERQPAIVASAAPLALALIVGAMAAIMFAGHRPGHWWGDDWALYLRQAQALLDGEPGRVFDENRFTVEMSRGAPFSPPLYPWGFPLILAPFVAVVGTDVDRLAIVPVLCACAFACSWYVLARPRIGTAPALVGVGAVTMTPLLLGWTELLQSEWPFLAVTFAVLVGLDRVARSDLLVRTGAPNWPLVLLGLGAAASFSVRREGLGMIAAIGAAQLALLIEQRAAIRRRPPTAALGLIARLAVPHAVAGAAVWLLQVVLPTTVVPRYSGTSVANVWRFAERHIDHLAEVSGLKTSFEPEPLVLGSATLGWIAVAAYLTAASAGAVLALTVLRRRDLHLLAYAACAFVIGGSFRAALNRYVVTVAPLLLLLGVSAVAYLLGTTPWRRLPAVVTTAMLGVILVANLVDARTRIDNTETILARGQIEWGATHPDAVEMFEAVERLSDESAVVAAPKARAMTLETGRLAVQADDHRPLPPDVPIALVVAEHETAIAEQLEARPDRYELVWSNTRFLIYRDLER